jgi:ABC-type lipoprotein release transport system permease subunit
MLAALAWRNIWRNARRSGILVAAIAIGLWGGLTSVGIVSGMYDAMISSAIDRNLAHLQLHARGFQTERDIALAIPEARLLAASLRALPGVTSVCSRTIIEGMGASPTTSRGVLITGIDPAAERGVTTVWRHVQEGAYFEGASRFPAVIGRPLARKLDLKLRGKIVLSFQRPDGSFISGAFRIAGIYDTESSAYDEQTVFVQRSDLDALAGASLTHEIAVRLATGDSLAPMLTRIQAAAPGLQVESWKDLAPALKMVSESGDINMSIFLGIILLALLFGITNTMLMSVLDRVREFGLLMAVGMHRRTLFALIVLETLLLSITGSLAGIALGSATVAWLGHAGFDLGVFSRGLSQFGIGTTLYPSVHTSMYPVLALMVVLVSCAAAIYPAAKAVRLHPASALATFG